MVKTRVEGTLKALRSRVYITFEESRARTDVRNQKVFSVKAYDFDNPFLSHYYKERQGGRRVQNTGFH